MQAQALLYHRDWETRVAAGHLVGALAEHCAFPSTSDLSKILLTGSVPHNSSDVAQAESGASCKSLARFNLAEVLQDQLPLLASSGEVGPL